MTGWLEPEGAEVRGREPLRRNLAGLLDAWESYRLELVEVHDAGDRVVAVVRELARGRASGVEVGSLWGYLITVTYGRLGLGSRRSCEPALALAAAGLPAA